MRQDEAYLLDMLLAARKAVLFAQDLSWDRFAESDLHQNAIFKVLEIVGEAASRISDSTRTAHPEIPWRDITDLRNRIVHAYFTIDLAVIWHIVKDDVPDLICKLERIAPPETRKDLV